MASTASQLVVDDFIDRVMTDPRLNANPLVNEAQHRVAPPGFKYLVTEINGKEWDGFLDDFQVTLDKFAVATQEQAELKAIVNSTRPDIVVDTAAREAATS
ncbi:MAG: hemoglobin [Bryobacterales bacterium]|nr:hemoglobin [Bryobacterales bacterium]